MSTIVDRVNESRIKPDADEVDMYYIYPLLVKAAGLGVAVNDADAEHRAILRRRFDETLEVIIGALTETRNIINQP